MILGKPVKKTTYVARQPDENGVVEYSSEDNLVWRDLIAQQRPIVENRACEEYLRGLDILDFSSDRIPSLLDVTHKLTNATGWSVKAVPALITPDHFFKLLSERHFPAATFIRKREELNYLEEPDIFHEFFGHCPMLTDPAYANFMQRYGQLGVEAAPKDKAMLMRIYWFTVEFGLISTQRGLRIYGGGILSSIGETPYCLESEIPTRKPFDVMEVLRTPYRIDIKQLIYYVIPGYDALFDLLSMDLHILCDKARTLGMYTPTFPVTKDTIIY